MTLTMQYNIVHLFLKICKDTLSTLKIHEQDGDIPTEDTIQKTTVVIISATAALEAFMNNIYREFLMSKPTAFKKIADLFVNKDDEFLNKMCMKDKILFICGKKKIKIDWGKKPYQDITLLIHNRNWLVHYKYTNYLGICNHDGYWVNTTVGGKKYKKPFFDPREIFHYEKVKEQYDTVRLLFIEINKAYSRVNENEDIKNETFRKAVSST